LPMSRIASAVETGDYHDSMLLDLEEYSIGKAPHTCAPASPMNDWKLQWTFGDRLDGCFDCLREAVS
jgi:hypothetical protein